MFFEFDEQEVVPQLRLGDSGWVAANVLVDEPQLAVVRVPGSVGVVAQRQMLGEPSHRRVRMVIVHRVGEVSGGGPNRSQGLRRPWAGFGGVLINFICVRRLI